MDKWPIAVYLDSTGTLRDIDKAQLQKAAADPVQRAKIRNLELWDESQEYRLFPRFRDGSPHFYSASSSVRILSARAESSIAHENRVNEILAALTAGTWKVGYYAWDGQGKDADKVFEPLFATNDYRWETEVTRTLTSGVRWRHDVFGAKLDLRTSERFPWFAVEVIDSHYPDAKALNAWLEASRGFPLLVAFDVVQLTDYFFQFNKRDQTLRISYYIYDGAIWNGTRRWESRNATLLKERIQETIKKKNDETD